MNGDFRIELNIISQNNTQDEIISHINSINGYIVYENINMKFNDNFYEYIIDNAEIIPIIKILKGYKDNAYNIKTISFNKSRVKEVFIPPNSEDEYYDKILNDFYN